MTTAHVLIPPVEEHYPRKAVEMGLMQIGIALTDAWPRADMLVTWSPWLNSHRDSIAEHFRRDGRPVIVVENGWLSPIRERAFYQLAFDGWNGTGRFRPGGPERWAAWRVMPGPWRFDPLGHALVIGQRGHPSDRRTAERDWHLHLKVGNLRVKRRSRDCSIPLQADLAGARECHVWTSNAASWAIIFGVPVVQHGPNLAVAELASRPDEALRYPPRERVLERLAWMQWSTAELASGEAFAHLLGEAVA